MRNLLSIFVLILFFSCETPKQEIVDSKIIFVGSYTKKEGHVDGKGNGISRKDWNVTKKGALETHFYKRVNPSFLTISSNNKYLYAVNELNPNDGESGTVEAFKIDEASELKSLKFINKQKTHAFAPCHISVDANNEIAFVSNYVGGVVAVYPILENGGLDTASQIIQYEGKSTTDRQEASHPHSTTISPDNKYVYVADLGTDKIMTYRIDFKNKQLVPTEQKFIKMQNGAGPRHMDFHPNNAFTYVMNELDRTVNVFDYDASNGNLTQKQSISTLPEGFSDFSLCADIHVHPNGKFLYASNRGHNSIVIYNIDKDGLLTLVGHESSGGDFPRNFAIESSGKYLWVANQNSDNIVQFAINESTGELKEVNRYDEKTPVCLHFFE